MKKSRFATVALVAAALLFVTPGAAEDDVKTLRGGYIWEQGGAGGDLEAVFTPAGEGTWNVDFHFEFRGKPHVYSGSAEGDLGDGRLEGRVMNENKKRTFTFEGSFAEGVFEGTHAEIDGERTIPTGTLTLR